MGFVFYSNMYAINGHTSGVLPLAVAKLYWAFPTSPENVNCLHNFIAPHKETEILGHENLFNTVVGSIFKASEVYETILFFPPNLCVNTNNLRCVSSKSEQLQILTSCTNLQMTFELHKAKILYTSKTKHRRYMKLYIFEILMTLSSFGCGAGDYKILNLVVDTDLMHWYTRENVDLKPFVHLY